MADATKEFSSAIARSMEELRKRLIVELQAQGHRLTGALEKSIQYEIESSPGKITAVMTAADYGLVIEFGVPASRIPYGGSGGRGGQSKYIQGLVRFFELRGVTGKEALRAAFATAAKHKREGMPSRGSFAFSSNGRRTGFVRNTLQQYLPELTANLNSEAQTIIEIIIGEDIYLEPYKIAV